MIDDDFEDIGHGVKIQPFEWQGVVIGYHVGHPAPTETGRCLGSVRLAGRPQPDNAPVWTVEKESPLTLSPSILCRTCGHHGFIRDGKWVPA